MAKAKIIKRSFKISGDAAHFADNLKKTAWSAVVESLVLVILGLLFVIWPDTIIKLLAYIIGVFLIVKGIYGLAIYYYEKGQNDFYNNGLLSATVFILLGIISMVLGENIASIFRVIVGIIIIYESLVRINAAVKLSSAGIETWRYALAVALILMALGVFVTFYNGAVVTLIGWVMIAAGIIAIIGDITFVKHVNTVADKFSKISEGVVVKDKKK